MSRTSDAVAVVEVPKDAEKAVSSSQIMVTTAGGGAVSPAAAGGIIAGIASVCCTRHESRARRALCTPCAHITRHSLPA